MEDREELGRTHCVNEQLSNSELEEQARWKSVESMSRMLLSRRL